MNLPWDKSYFKLCFYIIFTFMIIYIFKNAVDLIVYALLNMGGIYRGFLKSISVVLSVFSVIIIGFAIAYVLNPLVEYFVGLHIKRGLSVMAAFLILLIFILLIAGGITLNITEFGKYTMYEGIEHHLSTFSKNSEKVLNYISSIADKYNLTFYKDIKDYLVGLFDKIYILKIGKWFAQLFLSLIISVYFLKDKGRILKNVKMYYNLLPEKITHVTTYILINLNRAFMGYIKGQFTDAVILSAIMSTVLSLIGVPFSVPIGIISGFLNIIPYFGAVFGFIMTVGITVLSGEYMNALYAGIAIFIIQQIDSICIVPKIVGENVKLSPVVVIIALAVAANIFGIWGMIFVVPVVSFFKIIIDDYLKSDNKAGRE